MQTQKIVFSKLFKKEPTALAKKKIALTVADDIDLAINMITPLMADGEYFSKKLRDLGKQIADLNTDLENELMLASAFIGLGYLATEQVDEALKKAEDAADSLGLEPSFIPGYSNLKGLADVDYFSIKGVEDAYYEAVKYEADRLLDTVNNDFN
jgi:hypothetical protein